MIHNLEPPQKLKWTPELVNRFWDVVSKTKLSNFSFSAQAGTSLIILIEHLLTKNCQILDFGAGDGDLATLLCERGYQVAAFEPSELRAAKLRERLRYSGFLGVLNAHSTQKFDVVIMAEVIEHILDEQLDSVIDRLAGFVKTGGTLIITTPNNEDLELMQCYCPISNTLFHRWQHVRSFTEETLADLLAKYGFERVVSHCVEFSSHLFMPAKPSAVNPSPVMPSYIRSIRENIPTRIGSESNILYIGRRC